MATGGIFLLISNDGKQDRMLMATQLLQERLKLVREARAADASYDDDTPTLMDIERTHILFMNAHFKPFAAIGYEYNKVRPTSGTFQLDSEVQFSIPQFGDFFHDMCFHCILEPPSFSSTDTVADAPHARWADYPGERLLKRVKFEVNGNPLDDYTRDAYNFHRQFQVAPNKRAGYDRCAGQSAAKSGVLAEDAAIAPSGHRVKVTVEDGFQTPKASADFTDSLEVFMPLLFWCNKDPRLAVPSVSIPYGQRFITVTLGSANELVSFQNRGAGATANVTWGSPTINTIELYINNIFVNPEVHEIFIKRIGFTLIRVHRLQTRTVNKDSDEIHLNNLKWPIESLFIGMRVQSNTTAPTPGDADAFEKLADWDKFSDVTRANVDVPNVASTATTATVDASSASTVEPVVFTFSEPSAEVATCVKTIDQVTLTAHGIPIYNEFPEGFHNSYIPLTYGGYNINTPDDCGALMVTFNLYPGTYQPSGHVNVSRAREFYLKYTSSVVDASTNGILVVLASALNFLLISDGSAVLRYST